MTEPVLAVKDLSVSLSRNGQCSLVLDRVGFEVMPGEIVALVGESGSGKSTLGFALPGLLPRESDPRITGSIRLAGTEIVGADQDVLRRIRRGVIRTIPQDPMGGLDPTMTIRRQMAESADGRVADWLGRTGLADPDRIAASLPHRLSGGQRQRVLIAMAMMAHPRVLVADEPTTALDVTTQKQILELLSELAREHDTAMVFITHDLAVAASLADRVIVLYAGRIAEMAALSEVLARAAHPYSAGLLAARFDLRSDRRRPLPTLPANGRHFDDMANACAYVLRCPLARADCATSRPLLRTTPIHPGAVACHHAEETPALVRATAPAEPWPVAIIEPRVVLRLTGVRKSFDRLPKPVLDSIDLRIHAGECVGFVGESGSGKTTLLRIAAGLVMPDRGEVEYSHGGQPQVVFQDATASLTPWLSIGEQIGERLHASIRSATDRRARVLETLTTVGLDPRLAAALPAELSGGQCQRAAIARSIIVPPSVLLCDEPISSIDASMAAMTLNLLGGLRRQLGMAVLFVTHDLAAARIIADRIVVLHDGRLIEDADPDTLITGPATSYTRSLIDAVPSLAMESGR